MPKQKSPTRKNKNGIYHVGGSLLNTGETQHLQKAGKLEEQNARDQGLMYMHMLFMAIFLNLISV